jgi:hypothetical protein
MMLIDRVSVVPQANGRPSGLHENLERDRVPKRRRWLAAAVSNPYPRSKSMKTSRVGSDPERSAKS